MCKYIVRCHPNVLLVLNLLAGTNNANDNLMGKRRRRLLVSNLLTDSAASFVLAFEGLPNSRAGSENIFAVERVKADTEHATRILQEQAAGASEMAPWCWLESRWVMCITPSSG